MEFVPHLLSALRSLKSMYDQHGANKQKIVRLQKDFEEYEKRIPELLAKLQQHGVRGTALDDLNKLEVVLKEAIDELKRWSANSSFFRMFSSKQRTQKLDGLEADVMASRQKAVESMTLGVALQASSGNQELLALMKQLLQRLTEPMAHQAQNPVVMHLNPGRQEVPASGSSSSSPSSGEASRSNEECEANLINPRTSVKEKIEKYEKIEVNRIGSRTSNSESKVGRTIRRFEKKSQ